MNPDKIQIAIFDGQQPDPHLLQWCKQFSHVERVSRFQTKAIRPHMAVWRNSVCDWFLRETRLEAVLFLEHNKLPAKNTINVIASNADIAWCDYVRRDGDLCHEDPDQLGTGCLRISRHALETIVRPWFNYRLAPDGCSLEQCSCQWFSQRAIEAGFRPVKVGWVARLGDSVFWPADGPGSVNSQRYTDFRNQNQ